MRRQLVLRKRGRVADIWPILPGSERPPENWQGWPEGKEFAVVLTHDVEGPAGLKKCVPLMKLEQELGFRSSFNFIPEGSYRVPVELRQELGRNGFEVGLHDLKHDGHLFESRSHFLRSVKPINGYLKEWGAVGFRSGFMLHELDWLHALNIRYDLSTFDSDPFEPQPEGRNTIFPFWMPRETSEQAGGDGYVELPYTLPQDSTLFLFLREPTNEIWHRKLGWIARHGGMALVNVHPDYIQFESEPPSSRTYPVAHYRQFLEHLRDCFGTTFWQPLPRQMAEWVASMEPRPLLQTRKRIAMVTHSYYKSDNRVTRYAEALAARGDQVEVFALRRSPELPDEEVVEGVKLFRIQDRFDKTERTKLSYLWPLLTFLGRAAKRLAGRHTIQPYDLLHIHNVPDFMVFAGLFPKLTGARVILDIHDIVPEFFASKFGMESGDLTVALLRGMERVSAMAADHVIIANDLWRDKYAARTRTDGRCTAFINHVDSRIFAPRAQTRHDDRLIVLFPGGLQWHQGVDIAIRAFEKVSAAIPSAEFHIYGDGNVREALIDLTKYLGLEERVLFFKPRTIREIAAVMADADLGVVPKRADSFGDEAYSTKIMEFMSVGVPVIVSSTKVDRHYFDDSIVRFFPSGDVEALAGAIIELLQDSALRRELAGRAMEYVAEHCWEKRKPDYLNLIDSLTGELAPAQNASAIEADTAGERVALRNAASIPASKEAGG